MVSLFTLSLNVREVVGSIQIDLIKVELVELEAEYYHVTLLLIKSNLNYIAGVVISRSSTPACDISKI